MRSNVVASLSRGAVAVALGLSLIFGSLILGSLGAGSSASAEGPASVSVGAVFYGYVFTDMPGAMPDRVRAIGPTGAVCGSAEVVRVSATAGFYALSVVSSDLKPGCPPRNGVVQFSLFSGRLDDGVQAEQVAALERHDTPQILNLRPATSVLPNWTGTPGNVEGGSLLRWAGIDTPLAAALATLSFEHGAVYRLDASSAMFVEVTSMADVVLTAGDLLLVRFQ